MQQNTNTTLAMANGTDGSGDITVRVERVTPAMARDLLERTRLDGQRSLREDHVRFLANEIEQGRFRLSAIDIRTVDGQDFLVNGQHRLHAIVRAGVDVQVVMVRRCASDREDMARDYAAFDRGLIRLHSDALAAYGLVEETGLTLRQLRIVSSTAPLILGGFQAGTVGARFAKSTQVRAEFVRDWARPALLACAVIGESNLVRVRRLYNAAVFAVVLVTFRYDEARAERFWGRVAQSDGLRPGDPELVLTDFVVENAVGSGRRSNPYIARAVAGCWNTAYQGRVLKLLKVYDQTTPIRILGTPYDGKGTVAYEALRCGGGK